MLLLLIMWGEGGGGRGREGGIGRERGGRGRERGGMERGERGGMGRERERERESIYTAHHFKKKSRPPAVTVFSLDQHTIELTEIRGTEYQW